METVFRPAQRRLRRVRTVRPGHFGNSYELLNEMREVLAEALSGASIATATGSTWTIAKILRLRPHLWAGRCPLGRKKINYASRRPGPAPRSGLTPNHVYLDQCLPELLAVKGGRVFGQLICPSKPKAAG